MTRQLISFVFLMILCLKSSAQYEHIIHQGSITYESKVNRLERAKMLLGLLASSTKYREYILSLQSNRFYTRDYQLDFNKTQSVYGLLDTKVSHDFIDLLIGIPTMEIVRKPEVDSVFIKKQFGDDQYFIADRSQDMKWKYTNERMDILGYECRRANGLLMDSIYVVAFYCPQIDVSFGPSIFSGLPGMVLGVSIPQEHIHIFATKINLTDPSLMKEEILRRRSDDKTETFLEFGEYLKTLLGDRFDDTQWDLNLRGIRF